MDESAVTIDKSDGDQRVTGGGWIPYANAVNGKAIFGFTVYYNKNAAPRGNFVMIYRVQSGDDILLYKIKSNSWAKGGLTFTGTTDAYFTAKATLTVVNTRTGATVYSSGNAKFMTNIFDGDLLTPKVADRLSTTITDGSATVMQVGNNTNLLTLGGGNVAIHKPK
jgi:hypothetical protein